MRKLLILCFALMVAAGFIACGDPGPTPPPDPKPDPEQKDTTEVVNVEPANSIVVYQANEKIFSTNDAFQSIDARLDEISELSVDVLWLMPIHPIGREKTANSPYCVRDFKGVNPNFGTEDDLKNLVNHAHQKGMKVILDWVANHSALDHPWVSEHPDWYGTATGDEKNWNDVKPFNFNNRDMRDAMIDAMTYWIREADIDGYRCDYAQGCPDDFWEEAIKAIRAIKPEAIMLAETSRLQLFDKGFDWMYSWSYLSAIQKLMVGGSLLALYSTSDKEMESTPAGHARLRYITNHDACSEKANRDIYKSAQGMLSAACITYFLEGIPLIYSSQEIGYLNKINFCCTSQASVKMNWDSNPEILAATKKLMQAYKATAKLRGGKQERITTDKDIAFITYTVGKEVLVVLSNITGNDKEVTIPMDMQRQQATDMLTGDRISMPRILDLPPYGYAIYTVKKN